MTVIIKGEAPDVIKNLPEVKWYGDNPIKSIERSDFRKVFGDTLIYTKSAQNTIAFLINQCDFKKEDIFWQDLDAYGETKVLPILMDPPSEEDYFDGDETDKIQY